MPTIKPELKFFANRQISTGWFIPAGGKRRWGHTRQMPDPVRPPRLFPEFRNAHFALRFWLKGEWYSDDRIAQDPLTGEDRYYGPVPHEETARDPADFETVMVKLSVTQIGIYFDRGRIEA